MVNGYDDGEIAVAFSGNVRKVIAMTRETGRCRVNGYDDDGVYRFGDISKEAALLALFASLTLDPPRLAP